MKAVMKLAGLMLVPAVMMAQDARPIALDEAVRLARRNAPASVQSENAIRQAAGTVRQRYAAFLPTVNFSAGASTAEGFSLAQVRDPADSNRFISVPRGFDTPWNGNHGINATWI